MDRATISHLAHARHPVAAPLDDQAVARLLDVALDGRRHVVDLGCGSGAWLLTAVRRHPRLRATGVDLSDLGFDRARADAEEAGAADRVDLRRGDVGRLDPPGDVDAALCVGATHALGGLVPTLDAVRRLLPDDGVLVLGDGFWEREPSPAALDGLGAAPDDLLDLAGTVAVVEQAGWVPVDAHVSTQREWDDYEWSWTGTLERWALEHPEHPDAEQVRSAAREHRRGWLEGYRGTLGFVTFVLRRSPVA